MSMIHGNLLSMTSGLASQNVSTVMWKGLDYQTLKECVEKLETTPNRDFETSGRNI
jgi:hypothetical protein